ncbi:hypothetical protein L3V86_09315 [Thiotrichales bacterium 19S11-10]|nr:hypothetical protein [Thiotrichales bacterium 19S11-10]
MVKMLAVKFVPWNENSLSSIINKTIKFSTVYEFNDFNELRYLSVLPIMKNGEKERFIEIIKEEYRKILFLKNLQTLVKEQCNLEYQSKVIRIIEEGRLEQLLEEDILNLLNENLAYSNVGIFCLSKIDVFNDDAAQLMLAHYAQNLTGIALIYEITGAQEIMYNSQQSRSCGLLSRCLQWHDGCYTDISDFLYKSEKWKYENEVRIFSRPGIKTANQSNADLKAILYTPRFAGSIKTLSMINDKIYDTKLQIREIFPKRATPNSSPKFLLADRTAVSDFFKN